MLELQFQKRRLAHWLTIGPPAAASRPSSAAAGTYRQGHPAERPAGSGKRRSRAPAGSSTASEIRRRFACGETRGRLAPYASEQSSARCWRVARQTASSRRPPLPRTSRAPLQSHGLARGNAHGRVDCPGRSWLGCASRSWRAPPPRGKKSARSRRRRRDGARRGCGAAAPRLGIGRSRSRQQRRWAERQSPTPAKHNARTLASPLWREGRWMLRPVMGGADFDRFAPGAAPHDAGAAGGADAHVKASVANAVQGSAAYKMCCFAGGPFASLSARRVSAPSSLVVSIFLCFTDPMRERHLRCDGEIERTNPIFFEWQS